MIAKDLYEHFEYIGRLQSTDFYRTCNHCGNTVKDKANAMGSHLKKYHPEFHKNWSEYKTKEKEGIS